ncbi:hypothetical protein [Pantoea eucrina]|uniref:hypothetical protein n=1 Tax=Pantoea eucrina TaxID=472693 RepID=UPI00080F45CB|nr:hypothetical protein [Pantoea eucrina]
MKLIEILQLTAGKFDTGKHDQSYCQLLSNHDITLECRDVACHNCPLNRKRQLLKEMDVATH